MPMPETEWTGRYQTIEVTEWWCPTATEWVDCPGEPLCVHLTERTRKVNAKVMRLIDGSPGPFDSLPPISDEQRTREEMGVYAPVYPELNDGEACGNGS